MYGLILEESEEYLVMLKGAYLKDCLQYLKGA